MSLEIERKFLLYEVPNPVVVQSSECKSTHQITQYYLMLKKGEVRIRHDKTEDGETYFVTLKRGMGITREEFESTIDKRSAEILISVADKRISKIRRKYFDHENQMTWEVDDFGDGMVIAEIEMQSEDEEITTPTCFEGLVVREVTDERDYVNINLAEEF